MPAFTPGLVHTPATPFSRERSVDFALYGKLIDFHIGSGAHCLHCRCMPANPSA
jgi:dihydrodipicolinate synthase/N-acetylneuraminate lyase